MNNNPSFQPQRQPNMPQNAPQNMPPNGPMMQQGMPNQMGGYPQQYPYPNQQMMPRPPKQPMDPAKKKKIIIWSCVGGAAAILGITAAIVIPIILRVDYSTAYNTAKELKPSIYNIYQNSDCENAVEYLDSSYASTKTYNKYVEGCKETFNQSVAELVDKLGATEGVSRNGDINAQFEAFRTTYNSIAPDAQGLQDKLEIYSAYHNFVSAASNIGSKSADSEITAAANYLINSSNDTLKTYGEGWLEKYIAYAHAYQSYTNNGYKTSDYNLQKTAEKELKEWISTNKPDIKSTYQLNFDNTPKVKSEFDKLYELIRKTYAENYYYDNGDCTEILTEVICD